MNPNVSRTRTRHQDNGTPSNRSKWYNEIEKRKAIKNNIFPQSQEIKQSLGESLGQIVIDMIPKHVLQLFKSELSSGKSPLHFGLAIENLLSKNIKLTPIDSNDDTALNIRTILRVGDRIKGQVMPKWEDVLNNIMEIKLDELKKEKKNNLAEEILNVIGAEEDRYDLKTDAFIEKHNSELVETKKSTEEYIMNKCEIKLEEKALKIMHNMNILLNVSVEENEKELRDAFHYQMQLARNELFEEFQNMKLDLEYRWDIELKTLKENNNQVLKHLQISLETEHVHDLIELEHWYDIRNKKTPVTANGNRHKVVNQNEPENGLLQCTQFRQIDNELLEKNRELLVYKKRLQYILNGYVDFIENNLQAKLTSTTTKHHLNQAKTMLVHLGKTETGI